MKTPNWPAIRHEYLAGYIDENGAHQYYTLEQIAERYGLSHSTLLHRSSDEGWKAKREEFQGRIYREAIEKFEGQLSERLCRADRLAVDVGLAVMQAIHDVLMQEPETQRERVNLAIRYTKTFTDALSLVHTGVGIEQLRERLDGLEIESEEAA